MNALWPLVRFSVRPLIVVALLEATLAVHAQNTPIFQTGIYNAGGGIVVADFNLDGNQDIATGNGTLLLGNGDGTFRYGKAINPACVGAAADFNHDGRPDLVGVTGSGTLSVCWETATVLSSRRSLLLSAVAEAWRPST
jgi:hypothetical protein